MSDFETHPVGTVEKLRAELDVATRRADDNAKERHIIHSQWTDMRAELAAERDNVEAMKETLTAMRFQIEDAEGRELSARVENDKLRADLAARDALLKEARRWLTGKDYDLAARIDAALKGDDNG